MIIPYLELEVRLRYIHRMMLQIVHDRLLQCIIEVIDQQVHERAHHRQYVIQYDHRALLISTEKDHLNDVLTHVYTTNMAMIITMEKTVYLSSLCFVRCISSIWKISRISFD